MKKENQLKRYFIETNAGTMVIFADSYGKCYVFPDTCFDERLTLKYAKTADYSGIDGCETADEIRAAIGMDEVEDTEEIMALGEVVIEF